jgi:predicted membrane protein
MSEPPDERRPRPAAVQLHEPDDAHLPAVAPDDAEEEDASKLVASYVTYDSVSALFGSLERSGEWQVPDRLRVRARFGEVKLDFRRAELPADGVVEIDCDALCGQIDLTVPEGSEVEMEGVRAILGELKHRSLRSRARTGEETRSVETPEAEPALFVLSGRAILGAIHVITR